MVKKKIDELKLKQDKETEEEQEIEGSEKNRGIGEIPSLCLEFNDIDTYIKISAKSIYAVDVISLFDHAINRYDEFKALKKLEKKS